MHRHGRTDTSDSTTKKNRKETQKNQKAECCISRECSSSCREKVAKVKDLILAREQTNTQLFINSWPERKRLSTVRYHCFFKHPHTQTHRHTHLYQAAVWMINLSPSKDGVVLCCCWCWCGCCNCKAQWTQERKKQWKKWHAKKKKKKKGSKSCPSREVLSLSSGCCCIHEWIQILIQTDILINHRQLASSSQKKKFTSWRRKKDDRNRAKTYNINSHTHKFSFLFYIEHLI